MLIMLIMSPNGLPFGWKSRPAHKFNNAMLRAYNANNMSPTGWGDNDEKNSDVKSNSDDVADESDDVAYDSDDVADESDGVGDDSDDVSDESEDDRIKRRDGYGSTEVADENDDVADENDDVDDENDDVDDDDDEELTYHYIVYDQNNDEQGYPDEVIEQIIADDLN